MADRVVVHVGPPKTGTTYVQSLLWANQQRLRDHGVLLPGRAPFDHNLLAARVRSDNPPPRVRRVWERVVAKVNAWPGTAVLSNEWFSLATRAQARRALGAFDGAEIHVVGTARDFRRVAPAAWQERLKLGYAGGLDDFVASLAATQGRWSWWTLDPAAVLARWGSAVPARRVHVVTLPAGGSGGSPTLLWDRFARACGIPPVADTDVSVVNESVGAESARLLQELGPRLRDAVDADQAAWTEQYRWLRRYVGHELLVPRGGSPIALRPGDAAELRARGVASAEVLRRAGYDVVGDLAELTPAERPRAGTHPDDVPDRALLDTASHLVVELLRELRQTATAGDRGAGTG